MYTKQITCENCGRLLQGIDRGRNVNEDFLQIEGRVTQYRAAEYRGQFIHATPHPQSRLEVCDAACLGEWVSGKTWSFEKRREMYLREQAALDKNQRLLHS